MCRKSNKKQNIFLDSIFTRNQPFDCVSPCSRSLLLFSVCLISQVCLFIYDNQRPKSGTSIGIPIGTSVVHRSLSPAPNCNDNLLVNTCWVFNTHLSLDFYFILIYSEVRLLGTRLLLGTSGYKELTFIPQSLPRLLVYYTFIRNSGYKEHIFMVPKSS